MSYDISTTIGNLEIIMHQVFFTLFLLPLAHGLGTPVPSGITALIESNNNYAFELYRALQTDDNLVFSPWSISTGMAMLYLGARNYTAREIESVLYQNEEGVSAREMMVAYGQLDRLMKRKSQLELTQFNTAIIQQGFPISETYRHRLFHYFNSVLYDLDMKNSGQLVKEWINILAEIKTNGLIKNILTRVPTENTKLLLLSGVHYKGQWVEKFDRDKTSNGNFYNHGNVATTAALMLSTSNYTYHYNQANNIHVLQIPLEGRFAMIFIMPEGNGTLREVAETLNPKLLQKIIEKDAAYKMIKLVLPKFKLLVKQDLSEPLQEMGMRTLFSPINSDLTGIDANGDLFLKDVVHQATIEVNEEGVEASAVTLLGVESRLGAPYIAFNRPFLFLVQDLDTRLILFMGHLKDCSEVCGVSNFVQQESQSLYR